MNWVRRIFRRKALPTSGAVQDERVRKAEDESHDVRDADDDATLERINRELNTGVYGRLDEKDTD